jgi:hypothetical protein
MKSKGNKSVCPVCKKRISTKFQLHPYHSGDKTVCEKCGQHCHYACVVRVRDSYLDFSALEYSICRDCYPEIEVEDQLNRKAADAEGYEKNVEAKSEGTKCGRK